MKRGQRKNRENHKGLVNILKLLYRHFLPENQTQFQIFCEVNMEMVAKMCFQKKRPLQNSHPSRQQLLSTPPIILQLLFNCPSHLWAGSKLWSWAALLWDTTCCAISRLAQIMRAACSHAALQRCHRVVLVTPPASDCAAEKGAAGRSSQTAALGPCSEHVLSC